MLDAIAIRTVAPFRSRLDLGEIAEALLFYGRVHLFLLERDLAELIRQVGLDTTLTLVESDFARLTLLRDEAAVTSVGLPGSETHDFVVFEKAKNDRETRSRLEIVTSAFERATGRKGESRRAAARFLNCAEVASLNDGIAYEKGVSELSRRDLNDSTYVRSAMSRVLAEMNEGPLTREWRFDVQPVDGGVRVTTDGIDFDALTTRHKARHGREAGVVTPALLLDFLHSARVDISLAARANSELLTDPLTSDIMRERLGSAMRSAGQANVALFQEMILRGSTIGEAVRSGHKSLDQVLKLVERAKRFRSWVANKPADGNLLREYHQAVTGGSWIDRLPAKHYRWAVFTGLGVLASLKLGEVGSAMAGAALGTIDSYVIDPLLRGWNPGQFVERDLAAFVGRKPRRQTG